MVKKVVCDVDFVCVFGVVWVVVVWNIEFVVDVFWKCIYEVLF